MKKTLLILFLVFLPLSVFASPPPPELLNEISEQNDIVENYKTYFNVRDIDINVPTVVEVELNNIDTKNQSFLVYDTQDEVFIPSLLINNYIENEKTYIVEAGDVILNSINDEEYNTSETFMLIEEGSNTVDLEFSYNQPITTDGFSFSLDRYVSLPNSITISYVDVVGNEIVIASDVEPSRSKIDFPEVTSNKFIVDIDYSQPLRITEASFDDLDLINNQTPGLRFLAQPGSSYVIFFDREYYVKVDLEESPNLYDDEDVLKVSYEKLSENELFVESDVDEDGVVDKIDNCVQISNSDQVDINNNGRGDVCDDYDRDGVINSKDNCPNDPNRRQEDIDGDNIGDACDDTESRVTEKYPFIVWGGIIFSILVFLGLYLSAIKSIKKQKEEENENKDSDIKQDID
jgi:hypothetical protein